MFSRAYVSLEEPDGYRFVFNEKRIDIFIENISSKHLESFFVERS